MPQNPIPISNTQGPAKTFVSQQADAQGATLISGRHGFQYEAAYNKAEFMAANALASPVALSAALATTYVGLCLSNPAASGKNLSLLNVSGALLAAPAALTTFALIVGYAAGGITVHTTPVTPLANFLGGAVGVGLVDAACTLVGTPAWARILAQTVGATTPLSFNTNIEGGIIIPPGGYVAIGANIATPATSFVGSFLWEEDPQ